MSSSAARGDRLDRHGKVAVVVLSVFYIMLLAGQFDVLTVDVRWLGMIVAALLASLFVNLLAIKTRQRQIFLVFFNLLMIWLTLSALWARPGARLADRILDLCALWVMIVFLSYCIGRTTLYALDRVWWVCYGASIVFALGGLLSATISVQGRVSAFGGGPNVFVRIMALGILAAIALTARNPRLWPTLIASPLFFMLGILSGSRGGLIALLTALGVTGLLIARHGSHKARVRSFMMTALGVSLFRIFLWDRVSGYVEQRFVLETVGQGYSSGRDSILQDCIELFLRHPLGGVGLDGYWVTIGQFNGYEHPHNLLSAAAAEAGLVGLALTVSLLIVGFRAASRGRDLSRSIPAVAAFMFLVASLFSGYWYDTRFIWFFLLLGLESNGRSEHQWETRSAKGQSSVRRRA